VASSSDLCLLSSSAYDRLGSYLAALAFLIELLCLLIPELIELGQLIVVSALDLGFLFPVAGIHLVLPPAEQLLIGLQVFDAEVFSLDVLAGLLAGEHLLLKGLDELFKGFNSLGPLDFLRGGCTFLHFVIEDIFYLAVDRQCFLLIQD
jgi:hypothetical protein